MRFHGDLGPPGTAAERPSGAALAPALAPALVLLGAPAGELAQARALLASGLLAFLLGALAFLLARRKELRRRRCLEDLREALDRVASAPVTPQVAYGGEPELESLVRAFNAMARRVEERSGSGRPASRELLEVLEDVLDLSRSELDELSVAEIRSTLSRRLGQEVHDLVLPREPDD